MHHFWGNGKVLSKGLGPASTTTLAQARKALDAFKIGHESSLVMAPRALGCSIRRRDCPLEVLSALSYWLAANDDFAPFRSWTSWLSLLAVTRLIRTVETR